MFGRERSRHIEQVNRLFTTIDLYKVLLVLSSMSAANLAC